ncbi:hypothetical protein [Mumia zhuanghuii]|uniref:Uncharacterized protein n=1 Tax=Mumia zhuanghuii TaxID=2585211 RepID=A0A5C4LT21_9ACTN|nr:hypothetical protein [Mumia zhuanghuii]TNC22167.1 hypothetical protein FHE65_35810 [Mumia zhuanghuii]
MRSQLLLEWPALLEVEEPAHEPKRALVRAPATLLEELRKPECLRRWFVQFAMRPPYAAAEL